MPDLSLLLGRLEQLSMCSQPPMSCYSEQDLITTAVSLRIFVSAALEVGNLMLLRLLLGRQ
jgi:hypothetical protein